MRKYLPLLVSLGLVTAGLGSIYAQEKPNFTGVWKLNVGKSDFGVMPPPDSRSDTIEQTPDGTIKDTVMSEGQQGKQNYTFSLPTNGTETTVNAGQRQVKLSAVWEGPVLVVTTKLDYQGSPVELKSNWTLSPDGKTMNQAIHISSAMGEMDQKYIFEKQEGVAVVGSAPTPPTQAAPQPPSTTPAPAAPSAMPAGDKPNFTGTWKLNVTKSDFGPLPAPQSQVNTIVHNDPNITMNVVQVGDQGKQDFQLKLTTDGKESVNQLGENQMKSTAQWQGKDLVVNSNLNVQGNDVGLKSVYSMSPDGKTITVTTHLASPMGEADQKQIYEKQ